MILDISDMGNYTLTYYAIPVFIVSMVSLGLVVYRVIREEFSFLGISFFSRTNYLHLVIFLLLDVLRKR